MMSAGVELDLSPAFRERTVTETPAEASVVTRLQMWGMEAASEEDTLEVERVPSAMEPPDPEKVPSHAVAEAWVPTLKVRVGSRVAETEAWSSLVIMTDPPPGSSLTQEMK